MSGKGNDKLKRTRQKKRPKANDDVYECLRKDMTV